MLAVLERHGVEYVLIGGFATQVHGATRPTDDTDVTPRRTPENLTRLAAALVELGARIRTDAVEGGLPSSVSGSSLQGLPMLKAAAGCPKDTEALPELYRLAREPPRL